MQHGAPGGVLNTSAPPLPLPSHAPYGASIPCGLTQLRILPVTTGVLLAPAVALCALCVSALYLPLFCLPPFVFTYLQNRWRTTPFLSRPYKTPGGCPSTRPFSPFVSFRIQSFR